MQFETKNVILTDEEITRTGLTSPIPLQAGAVMDELLTCQDEYILLASMRHDESFLGLAQQELIDQEMSKLAQRDKILMGIARHLIDRDFSSRQTV